MCVAKRDRAKQVKGESWNSNYVESSQLLTNTLSHCRVKAVGVTFVSSREQRVTAVVVSCVSDHTSVQKEGCDISPSKHWVKISAIMPMWSRALSSAPQLASSLAAERRPWKAA